MQSKFAVTLDCVLSRFALRSRTEARKAITQGRLKVNGRVVRDPGARVRLGRDVFLFDGKRLKPAERIYVAFHKPRGIARGFRIQIRRAHLRDAWRICDMHVASIRRLCARHYTREQIGAWVGDRKPAKYRRAMTARGEVMYAADVGRRIGGFVYVVGDEVRAVYVHPDFVARRVGTKLLRTAERAAARSGSRVLRLASTLNAVGFYRAWGLRVVRRISVRLQSGAVLPAIRMRKTLAAERGTD